MGNGGRSIALLASKRQLGGRYPEELLKAITVDELTVWIVCREAVQQVLRIDRDAGAASHTL